MLNPKWPTCRNAGAQASRVPASPNLEIPRISVQGFSSTAFYYLKELDQELNGKPSFGGPTAAISKLLFVANGRAIKLLMTYVAAHSEPIIVGYEVDNPHDLRRGLIVALSNMVEYADDRAYGKHPRSAEEWEESWKHGKDNCDSFMTLRPVLSRKVLINRHFRH
jgi:hypothetical protein